MGSFAFMSCHSLKATENTFLTQLNFHLDFFSMFYHIQVVIHKTVILIYNKYAHLAFDLNYRFIIFCSDISPEL
jgi:hypothetical protein